MTRDDLDDWPDGPDWVGDWPNPTLPHSVRRRRFWRNFMWWCIAAVVVGTIIALVH